MTLMKQENDDKEAKSVLALKSDISWSKTW